ncbi:MAG: metallophosphoesterase [Pirellulaceae bacterium]|nr:metallophosphoesterase [Pirellulaceae bacterium]
MMQRREAVKSLVAGGATGLVGLSGPAAGAESAPARQRSVRLVHLTDVHVQPARSAPQGLAQAIRHIHWLPDQPDFILNGGDAIGDALEVGADEVAVQWKLWKAAWKEHGTLPVRNCLGNHDIWGWNKAKSKTQGNESGWGKQIALEQLELERGYYRFDHGGWRFLILDSLTFDEETAYRAELDPAQFQWLTDELQGTPPEMPVAVASHVPILTVGTVGFSHELRKYPQATRMLSHLDAAELLMLLRRFPNVKLCLSGHTHLTEHVMFGGIGFVNSGAVSGLWWKGDFLHTDEGYHVIDLYSDGTYQIQYVSYGWQADGPGQR